MRSQPSRTGSSIAGAIADHILDEGSIIEAFNQFSSIEVSAGGRDAIFNALASAAGERIRPSYLRKTGINLLKRWVADPLLMTFLTHLPIRGLQSIPLSLPLRPLHWPIASISIRHCRSIEIRLA